ncbi:MAG TPA: glutamine synthetase III [Flavobacteriales bacterium]|nr:glutamine synthetase III [Flavobacteriales bacterium]
MATIRFKALEDLYHRAPKYITPSSDKVSDYFGENVFNDFAMRQHLTPEVYANVKACINEGTKLTREVAELVAQGMKEWAMAKGCSHYTHWFQPLTDATAEKHDAFFEPIEGGKSIEKFSGSMLVQQEPDASSFPNGGIRNTFEARGYTAWDPSSPAFIFSKTLCIPTIFISYTGEALDYKMPLLKAISAIDKIATEICQYFDKNVTKVTVTLGWEQEYFLIDEALYNARPDIMMSGRALFGHAPAKGQQLEDHYFGSIPERIIGFMKELEYESHRLGIPLKTRHNEVAPNQFECAPVFEELNVANDHNQLLMDLMEKIARKHNFRILLHEKPFAGVNGSGKHNNWSMATNTGKNLLSPGKTPKSNMMFLTFFINTLKAIHDHADVLRASIASAANDHRLGANEAPPAIISAFIGTQLTQVLEDLEKNVKSGKMTPEDKTDLKLNIGKIPQIMLDNTDRNRTSPFAFTGNKFEFRAVGSSANCANAMIALNTIMASQLRIFKAEVDKQIEKGGEKDEVILQILRKYIVESKKICFEGNGYSEEWVKEAAKRGLSNLKDTVRALDVLSRKETIKLYGDMGIFTERELEARHEIELHRYALKIQIEGRMIENLALTHIVPTAIKYQNKLADNIRNLESTLGAAGKKMAAPTIKLLEEVADHTNKIITLTEEMVEARKNANNLDGAHAMATAYCDKVRPYFEEIRYHVDKLEIMVDDELWPLPKMRELLFTK